MKARYIMILSLLAAVSVSCKVNDIAYYSQDARIEFSGASSYTFTDRDWLDTYVLGQVSRMEGEFTAQLIGYALDAPRKFYVKQASVDNTPFTPELQFEESYEFPAGEYTVDAPFWIICPDKEAASTSRTVRYGFADIVYDNSEGHQEFGEGRTENLSYRVTVSLDLYPDDWSTAHWGRYSTSKYFLMMEICGKLHKDIEYNIDNYLAIVEGYEAYKQEHGPLKGDDEYAGEEISFPDYR